MKKSSKKHQRIAVVESKPEKVVGRLVTRRLVTRRD